jgi:hypothetical protein
VCLSVVAQSLQIECVKVSAATARRRSGIQRERARMRPHHAQRDTRFVSRLSRRVVTAVDLTPRYDDVAGRV